MTDEFQMIKMELEVSKTQEQEPEEFYENIEAPKFVDFTTPDHYCPDDRYWFCQRVGCNLKHEEEMDSEAICKDFVLRVMAARSPNVKLQKALNRNALSKTMKCPMSAPPKSSKPRVSKLALISSLRGKLADDKRDVTKPQSIITSSSTPKAKTKQVAAKYLTTPRNRKCLQNETSFRSVQHPKPGGAAASKDGNVVKALVFQSPRKTVTIKTSVELRLSKLRRQKKPADTLRKRVTFKEESSREMRSGAQSEKVKIVSSRSPKNTTKKVAGKSPELTLTDQIPRELNGTETSSTLNLDLMSLDISRELENPSNGKPIVLKEKDLPKSEMPNIEDVPQGVEIGTKVTESDNKENSSAIDANRCLNKASSEPRSKIIPNGGGNLKKGVQLVDKVVKDGIISVKVRKPKPTNPKPFRFRTDERGILKEAANMEKKVHLLASRTEPSAPHMEGKLKRKQAKDIRVNENLQDKCNSEIIESSGKMAERKILAEVTGGETIQVVREDLECATAKPNGLMQVIKMKSPHRREMAKPEREMESSSIAPGTRPRKTVSRKENNGAAGYNKPSQKRKTVTIPKEPNFHTAHRPKACTSKQACADLRQGMVGL